LKRSRRKEEAGEGRIEDGKVAGGIGSESNEQIKGRNLEKRSRLL
jgi:hypothetical protein